MHGDSQDGCDRHGPQSLCMELCRAEVSDDLRTHDAGIVSSWVEVRAGWLRKADLIARGKGSGSGVLCTGMT